MRPAFSDLTASTLRKAHAICWQLRLLNSPIPCGLLLLDNDYEAWRRRVQRGQQADTPISPDKETR